MSNTKIVCTIGPSSWSEDALRDMINAGMSMARINASFADEAEIARVTNIIRTLSPDVAVLVDTMGHKIRVTGFEEDIFIRVGDRINLASEVAESIPKNTILVTYSTLAKDITRGVNILIDDGNVSLKVIDIEGEVVKCEVVSGTVIKKRKTVNIPGVHLHFPTLPDKDLRDIKAAIINKVDYIAASFVRDINDVKVFREAMGSTDIKLIAKIEDFEGVKNFENILDLVDGVMIARGDMAVELPLEQVPTIQKLFVKTCRQRGKLCIVATQMLESMKENIRPTRAEANDVANAVYDGADAVMLSAESSTGKHPTLVVSTMRKILEEAEKHLDFYTIHNYSTGLHTFADTISEYAWKVVNDIDAQGIIVISSNGKTVRSLSRHNGNKPIYCITNRALIARQTNLHKSVKSFVIDHFSNDRDVLVKTALSTIYENGYLEIDKPVVLVYGNTSEGSSSSSILEIINPAETMF